MSDSPDSWCCLAKTRHGSRRVRRKDLRYRWTQLLIDCEAVYHNKPLSRSLFRRAVDERILLRTCSTGCHDPFYRISPPVRALEIVPPPNDKELDRNGHPRPKEEQWMLAQSDAASAAESGRPLVHSPAREADSASPASLPEHPD